MNSESRHRIFVGGLLLSFMAIFAALAGLPAFFPTKTHAGDDQLALLYKIAERDVPRLAQGSSTKAVYVDLEEMEVSLIDRGTVIAQVPVLSRGRPGTFWETPTGNYHVLTKEPNHFSSIGEVWMPYSMQFYGNFFIHGWPYHENGEPVPKGYSGGCVRLSTEDAATVYAFVERGTPVYIRNSSAQKTAVNNFRYFIRGEGKTPEISANAFIVADLETGQVLWERKANLPVPLRGLSVLMSGVVALETVNQYKTVRMSELILGKPIPRDQKGVFQDELPIGALIYPLMFDGNDTAAKAYAADHGERNFVRNMNEKAVAVGMENTTYASSTASDSNTGTAKDMFMLFRNIAENKMFLINASLKGEHVIFSDEGKEMFRWSNTFFTQASSTKYRGGLLTQTGGIGEAALIYDLPLEEFGTRRLVFIVLGSNDAMVDVGKMTDFVTKHFVYAPDTTGIASIKLEGNEPTPSLWGKIRSLWKLDLMLRDG